MQSISHIHIIICTYNIYTVHTYIQLLYKPPAQPSYLYLGDVVSRLDIPGQRPEGRQGPDKGVPGQAADDAAVSGDHVDLPGGLLLRVAVFLDGRPELAVQVGVQGHFHLYSCSSKDSSGIK